MYAMFQYCSQLTQLDVSNWDTSSVTTTTATIFKPHSALLNWSIEEINRHVNINTTYKSTVYVNCDISKLNKNDLITYKYYNGNKIDIKCNEENPLLVQGNSIEKIEDDYKLYKNRDRLILEGNEEWDIYKTHDTTITFIMQVQDKIQENTPLLCNNIPYYGRYKGYHGYELDEENIYYYRNNLYVTISKFIIRSVEDFKAWLVDNPLEVIYTMQVQEEIPCTPLIVDNYDKSTIIQLDTNEIHSDIETRLVANKTIIPYSLKRINDDYDRIYWDVNTRSYKLDRAIEEVALTQQILSNNINKDVYETSNHYVMQFNTAIIGNTTKPFISNKFSVQEFSTSVGKYNTIMYTDTDIYVYILKDEIKENLNNNSFINKLVEWGTNLIYILNVNRIINIPNTRLPRLYQHDNTDIVIVTDLIKPSKVIVRYKDIL
jgi:surface protein